MATRPELTILGGELDGRRFTVGQTGLRLGRSSSNDIHVPDEGLSRNHCIFEPVGEAGVCVTDLASANGTFVNGRQLGSDKTELKEGDVIEVGGLRLRFGDAKPSGAVGGAVDLGLGERPASAASVSATAAASASPRPRFIGILWAVAIALAVAAIAVVLFLPKGVLQKIGAEAENTPPPPGRPEVVEVVYEKVRADSSGIFRYALAFSDEGVLTVESVDTANSLKLPLEGKQLGANDRKRLNEILAWDTVDEIARQRRRQVNPDQNQPSLDSTVLKVVYSLGVQNIRLVNEDASKELAAVQKRLEAFAGNALNLGQINRSVEELIKDAEHDVAVGEREWNDRDGSGYGHLAAAVKSFQTAVAKLKQVDTVEAQELSKKAKWGLEEARSELDRRYTDWNNQAQIAQKTGDWKRAEWALAIILELVPDESDERNQSAAAQLVEAQRKSKGGRQ